MNIPTPVVRVLALMVLCYSAVTESAPDALYRVLVLNSFRHTLPVNTDWYHGLVRGFASASDLRVEIDIEATDLTRFADRDYVRDLLTIYRRKYCEQNPDLVISTYTPALKFLLDHGDALFPGVPIVFLGADSQFVAARKLAPYMSGVTTYIDVAGTLDLALHVHPATRRVAVVVGSGAMDRQFERRALQQLQSFETRVEFIWYKGMPLNELTEAVRQLPERTVILYLVQLEDRTGQTHIPRTVAEALSLAAGAPIYGLWDTLLGGGIVGGRLAEMESDGFQAAQMALRILGGEEPADVAVVNRGENRAIFDGRELTRWNIGEGRLPAGSRIVNRRLSVWDDHGTEIAVVALVIGLQGFLIVGLLRNRNKLRRMQTELRSEVDLRVCAETELLRLRDRLARFSKERSLSSMTTAIAHEINQPLIAIQNYAQAARRRLQSKVDQTTKIDELFEKTEQQVARAADIIEHIRYLVCTNEVDLQTVSLDSMVEMVIQMVRPELQDHGFSIEITHAPDLPLVLADELEIQLVLVNLLQNAKRSMQSMGDQAESVVSIEIGQIDDQAVQISVADRGVGVSLDDGEHLFEPFYSGRRDGMGMGLAICRTIIDAHGGHIWHTPNPAGGVIFHFTLRVAEA